MNKRLLVIICLVMGLSGFAVAGPVKHEPNFERLAEKLNLSEDQTESFLAIMQEQHQQRIALRKQGREAFRPKMDALHEALIAKLSGVLTVDQLDEFKAITEQRQRERKKYRMLHAMP